jgi:hypothetical protein
MRARLSALHRGDFGPARRASLTGACLKLSPSAGAGSDTASSSHPGRSARRAGARPPGAAVANRHRGTPLLAPPSGSPLEDAPQERGWESMYFSCILQSSTKCVKTLLQYELEEMPAKQGVSPRANGERRCYSSSSRPNLRVRRIFWGRIRRSSVSWKYLISTSTVFGKIPSTFRRHLR